MRGFRRRWLLVLLVALTHVAVFWLLAAQVRRATRSPVLQVAIVGSAEFAALPAGLSSRHQLRPTSAPATSTVSSVKPIRPVPVGAPAEAAPPSVQPHADLGARPNPTGEPEEIDAQALEALNLRMAVAAALAVSPGEAACGVTDRLQQALGGTPAVEAALARIPPDSRSVANAVTVWNTDWSLPASLGGAAVQEPIRRVITAQIGRLSPACRDQVLQGPRLLILPSASGPTVLAIGSGRWRWADLLSQ